jgi:hypothetical protein
VGCAGDNVCGEDGRRRVDGLRNVVRRKEVSFDCHPIRPENVRLLLQIFLSSFVSSPDCVPACPWLVPKLTDIANEDQRSARTGQAEGIRQDRF